LIPSISKVTLRLQFTKEEEKKLDKIRATETGDGRWVHPDGKEMISNPMMTELMHILHRRHWGPQAMCDITLRNVDVCIFILLLYRYVGGCVTCQKVVRK
jgi:hypothetical protein